MAFCSLDSDTGPAQLCLGLAFLGVELDDIHLHKHIARIDDLTFGRRNVGDTAAGQRGDVDLGRLDPAIRAHDALRQRRRVQLGPGKIGRNRRDHQNGRNKVFRFLFHACPHLLRRGILECRCYSWGIVNTSAAPRFTLRASLFRGDAVAPRSVGTRYGTEMTIRPASPQSLACGPIIALTPA